MSLNAKSSSFPILPTVASFVAAQVTGALWYGPLFGKTWMKAMKESKPNFEIHGDAPVAGAAVMWLASSISFTTMVGFWKNNGGDRQQSDGNKLNLLDYLCLAHTAWLGFSLPGHVFATIFAEQHQTVSILGAGYSLTAFTFMALAHYWL